MKDERNTDVQDTKVIDTSANNASAKQLAPESTMQASIDPPVWDANEILVANEMEFSQLRRNSIKLIGSSLIKCLSNQLKETNVGKKDQILMSFLNQFHKEQDQEVKDAFEN